MSLRSQHTGEADERWAGHSVRGRAAREAYRPPVTSLVPSFRRQRARKHHSSHGFTLIELLAAAGITALLAGFIVAIVSNISGFWNRTSGRLSTEAQARYVLDQLTLDLSAAQFRDDGNVWFAADVTNSANGGSPTLWQIAALNAKPVGGVSLALTPPNIADGRFGNAGVWLRFFTTSRGSNVATTPTTISAPVAVGYRIIRRFSAPSPANTKTAYLFHRAEVRPARVTTTGTQTTGPGVLESGYTITAAAYTTTGTTTRGDPRTVQVPGARGDLSAVIADNVIDFGVRCYVRDATTPTGLRLIFPAADDRGTSATTNSPLQSKLPSNTPTTAPDYAHASLFPDVVEVMVRILTDEGARLISTFEQANSPLTVPPGINAQQYWWQLATANSQVYTRRIVINAKPL